MLFTSSSIPFGIIALLDGLVDFAPSSLDLPPWKGAHEGVEGERARRVDAPFAAVVVKNKVEAHGRQSIVRVVAGVLEPDRHVLCVQRGVRERIGAGI